MNEGYFPTITEALYVRNENGETLGKLNWDAEWDGYVFIPFSPAKFGPVFLVALGAHMAKLEAQKRKNRT